MIKFVGLLMSVFVISSCAELPQVLQTGSDLSRAVGSQPANAVKQALELSATRASDALAQSGAYSGNELYRVTLPEPVQAAVAPLRQLGLGGQVDRIEQLLNEGAERAAAEAKPVLVQAIRTMSIDDAVGIIRGGDTAATDYFRTKTETQLRGRYGSIMEEQLQALGFYTQYRQLLSAYQALPFANKPDLDLENHAINQGLTVLFAQIAKEERQVRANPLERGSALIEAMFGY